MAYVMSARAAEAVEATRDQRFGAPRSCKPIIKSIAPPPPHVSAGAQVPPFLTIEQAAKELQVHAKTAYRWASEGRLPGAFRVQRCWRVSRDKLFEHAQKGIGAPPAREGV
jgi:excisionase family DNA binding protein